MEEGVPRERSHRREEGEEEEGRGEEEEEEEDEDVDEEETQPPWPTVDGPLGVTQSQDACRQARNFFYAGFFLLPWLWFVNCFYFWPILRRPRSDPLVRPYVVWSGIGFAVYTSIILTWALTFAIGGEGLFGPIWRHLAVYDIADSYDLIGI